MEKGRVSADFSKSVDSLWKKVTTKKRRVGPTFLHPFHMFHAVFLIVIHAHPPPPPPRKSGKWIPYKKNRLAKSQLSAPNPPKLYLWMNTVKRVYSFPNFFVLNTGSGSEKPQSKCKDGKLNITADCLYLLFCWMFCTAQGFPVCLNGSLVLFMFCAAAHPL